MPIRVKVEGEPVGPQLTRNLAAASARIKAAVSLAADDVSKSILISGRADIRSAGRFGSRWTEGLTADVGVVEQGQSVEINVRQAVPYWSVFQYGKQIEGRPLLWIPLSFAADAQGIRARDYPGRLFRVDRKAGGAPLLLAVADKQPKYSGHESVYIPKKFHLVEIARDAAKSFGMLYRVRLQQVG